MQVTLYGALLALTLAAGAALAAGDHQHRANQPTTTHYGADQHVVVTPDALVWQPIGDQGAEMATIYGDPAAAAVYVVRLRVPAGLKIPPHTHAEAWRIVTVLSGTLHFGVGPTLDEAALVPYAAGTVFTEGPELQHYAWAKEGPVELQLTAMGPAGTTPVTTD